MTDVGDKTEKNQQLEPGLPPSAFGPPSLGGVYDAASREGFYESAYALLERRLASAFDELGNLRRIIASQRAQHDDVLGQLADWRALAFRYGTETTAEKRCRTNDLHGTLTIARHLVMESDEAINYACADLARKLRGALKRPERAPASDAPSFADGAA